MLLALGCTVAQLTSGSDQVLSTPMAGLVMAIMMAVLSGAAGVYTELIMKKQPKRNVNVQNIYLYIFGTPADTPPPLSVSARGTGARTPVLHFRPSACGQPP